MSMQEDELNKKCFCTLKHSFNLLLQKKVGRCTIHILRLFHETFIPFALVGYLSSLATVG